MHVDKHFSFTIALRAGRFAKSGLGERHFLASSAGADHFFAVLELQIAKLGYIVVFFVALSLWRHLVSEIPAFSPKRKMGQKAN